MLSRSSRQRRGYEEKEQPRGAPCRTTGRAVEARNTTAGIGRKASFPWELAQGIRVPAEPPQWPQGSSSARLRGADMQV